MDSSIDQKPLVNLLPEAMILRQIIMAMIVVAYVFIFQEYHKPFAALYQKQNRIEHANERPVVIGGEISKVHLKRDTNPSAGNTSKPVHVRETALLFQSIILQTAQRYKIEPALIMAIIMAESGYNPQAVSKMGAQGLMQLMPKTAKSLGVVDSFNPEQNIKAGVKYYKKLLDQFEEDGILALAAYNAGARKVRKHKGVPPIKATRHYIRKVVKYYQHYKVQVSDEKTVKALKKESLTHLSQFGTISLAKCLILLYPTPKGRHYKTPTERWLRQSRFWAAADRATPF